MTFANRTAPGLTRVAKTYGFQFVVDPCKISA
jgi:hypothetical protein